MLRLVRGQARRPHPYRRLAAPAWVTAVLFVLSSAVGIESSAAAPPPGNAAPTTTATSATATTATPSPEATPAVGSRHPAAEGSAQAVQVARNRDGRLETFCICGPPDAKLQHQYQLWPNGPWSGVDTWSDVDASLFRPIALQNRDGRLEVFFLNGNTIFHRYQLVAGGGWSAIGPLVSGVNTSGVAEFAVTTNADGRLELFYEDCPTGSCTTAIVKHLWQHMANGPWSAPVPLGPFPFRSGALAAFANTDGLIELFGFPGYSGTAWKAKQTRNGNWTAEAFSPYLSVGGSRPLILLNADGRAELFMSDGDLYHAYQLWPSGPWTDLTRIYIRAPYPLQGGLAGGRNIDGRLELFGTVVDYPNGPNSPIEYVTVHLWQTAPNGPFIDQSQAPRLTDGEPARTTVPSAAATNADGRLEVFLTKVQQFPPGGSALFHAWQDRPNVGPWTPIVPL